MEQLGAFTHFKAFEMSTVANLVALAGKELTLNEQMDELKKRVVRADKALVCCRAQENRVVNETIAAVSTVFNFITKMNKNEALVVAPAALALGEEATQIGVSRVFVTGARAIPVGAVVILAGAQVANWYAELWATEMAGAIASAVGTITRANRKNCYDCLKSKLLPQTHARQYETAKVRRRVG